MTETYYGTFYGFHTAPFHITPDPSLLFLTAMYEGALGAIEYGIKAGKGFIVVTGEVGVGKTTMLWTCLDRLDTAKTKIIYLFNPDMPTPELYKSVLEEFDPSLRGSDEPSETLRLLQRQLLEAHEAGIQVVLAVDEAQNMPDQTLESMRILSNIETNKTKLLQIILVGQPELDAKLKKHSLRQLAQRVAVRARLRRLSFRQSCRYIRHRTQRAGQSGSLFTGPAQWYIALMARGVPRTINICCDNALINGYGHSAKRITVGIAREACRSLEIRTPSRPAAALGAACLVLLGGIFYGGVLLHRFTATTSTTATTRPAPTTVPSIAPAESAATQRPGESPDTAVDTAPVVETAPSVEPAPSVDTAPSVEPAPAVEPAVAGSAPPPDAPPVVEARTPVVDAPTPVQAPPSTFKWRVRNGDSVYLACLQTYGSCDGETLRAVLAVNPQIRAATRIHDGDILSMPATIGPLRASPR